MSHILRCLIQEGWNGPECMGKIINKYKMLNNPSREDIWESWAYTGVWYQTKGYRNRMWEYTLFLIGSGHDSPLDFYCKHGHESMSSITARNFINSWLTNQLLKKDLKPWSCLCFCINYLWILCHLFGTDWHYGN